MPFNQIGQSPFIASLPEFLPEVDSVSENESVSCSVVSNSLRQWILSNAFLVLIAMVTRMFHELCIPRINPMSMTYYFFFKSYHRF